MSPLKNVHSEQNHPIGVEQVYWAKVRAKLLAAILLMLILLFLRSHGWAQGGGLKPTGSETQNVNCVSGCSSSSSPNYGSAFPASGTPIGFKLGANLSWATVDGSNNLNVNCTVGCSASAGFLDNAAFTAGTTALNIAGGWYTTSPTNCTSGSACAPQLTLDRKLFVQAFQGTSPWVVSQATGSNLHVVVDTAPTTAVTQSTSPWVNSVIAWGGGTLGAMANYGTSPGAVLVPGMNAFITNIPHVIVDTAPTTAVTGTFWQTTQPVSGTFWQTTQPVSGTFWQATQPVSGTVTTTPPANASTNIAQIGGTAVVADPCQANTKSYGTFSGTASLKIISGVSTKKIYFCSWNDQAAAAQNIAIVEGTGTVCATGIATFPGMSGGTTAATGWNVGANGGRTMGNGTGAISGETTATDDVCILLANAVQTNAGFSYVSQ